MKRFLTILPILSLLVISCNREPIADAIISPNPAYVEDLINFTNVSVNADHFEWNFGDGTTSTAFNASHAYSDPGLYLVTLKAFGRKGGVSTATFEVDVIGSQLKVIVREYEQEYYVPDASVILYPSLQDWIDETNPVDEQFTNANGECMFTGLRYQRYYVDVWEQDHDNYTLAAESVDWIETQLLEPGYDHTFVAWVDYYPPAAKKSTSRMKQKKQMMEEGGKDEPRQLKPNEFSKPLKQE